MSNKICKAPVKKKAFGRSFSKPAPQCQKCHTGMAPANDVNGHFFKCSCGVEIRLIPKKPWRGYD